MFGFGQCVSRTDSSCFKPTIPVFNGKQESFSRWKQESVVYSRRYGFDAVFTRADECQDVNVGDPDCPDGEVAGRVRRGTVISHLNAWQFLSALKSEKDLDIIFQVNIPRGPLGVFFGRRQRQRDWESCYSTRKRIILRSDTHWPNRRVEGILILVQTRDEPRPA